MLNDASLIILGNGFDINCGLNSKFSDFYKNRITEAKLAASTFYNNNCSNFWYLLLYLSFYDEEVYDSEHNRVFERIKKETPLWMDVEGFIKKVVATNKNDDFWMKRNLSYDNYISCLDNLFKTRHHSYAIGERNQYSSIRKYFCLNERNVGYKSINEYLYEQLLDFEEEFKTYLITCVENAIKYKDNFATIIGQLSNHRPFSILSFNYTSIPDIAAATKSYKGIYNVHGNLENRIVIGFDSSDVASEFNNSTILSKAWQKMNVTKTVYRLPTKGTINTIKFYGHSLGPQDYSYFHAIFDHFDIYNSDIKLEFYYTEYKDSVNDNKIIRNTYITSVYNLLNDYAFKSGNEEKVKTILSRLQLENRLIIGTIPKIGKNN